MLLLNYLRLAQDPKPTSRENRPRIAGAKRLKCSQILRELKPERLRIHLSIDPDDWLQILFSQARRCMFIQAAAKFGDVLAPDRESGRVGMPAEFVQQVATDRQAVKEMIGFDAARRAVADVAVERDHHAWSMQAFGDLRSSQADDSAMPSVSGG